MNPLYHSIDYLCFNKKTNLKALMINTSYDNSYLPFLYKNLESLHIVNDMVNINPEYCKLKYNKLKEICLTNIHVPDVFQYLKYADDLQKINLNGGQFEHLIDIDHYIIYVLHVKICLNLSINFYKMLKIKNLILI